MIKISRYQFDIMSHIKEVDFDDYHTAVEDECAIYKVDGNHYIVIQITSLDEDGKHPYIVFAYDPKTFKLSSVKDEKIVSIVLEEYSNDN